MIHPVKEYVILFSGTVVGLYVTLSSDLCTKVYSVLHRSVFLGSMKNHTLFSDSSPPVDKWFHVAAAWDQLTNEATLFLDGRKVGSQAQSSGSYLKDNSNTLYDIGLKRDTGDTLRGFLRDLIIIGKALSEKEIATLSGES